MNLPDYDEWLEEPFQRPFDCSDAPAEFDDEAPCELPECVHCHPPAQRDYYPEEE